MKLFFKDYNFLRQALGVCFLLFMVSMLPSCVKDDKTVATEETDTDSDWRPRDHKWSKHKEKTVKGLSADKDADKMAINLRELSSDTVANVAAPIEATDDLISEAKKVGGQGELKLTLLWDFAGDIDIHVQQPSGNWINYTQPRDAASGGYLDVDNVIGGSGSAENIYWENPPKGHYKVWLHYYSPSQANGAAGRGAANVVLIRKGERAETFQAQMSEPGDQVFITSFDIN